MPQPKKRHSNVRQGKRRFSNYRIKAKQSSSCVACGAMTLPHHACPKCGNYNGRQTKTIKEKKAKKDKE
ncbi:MAG: 50S ribosomal protein L32 [bacterium]